VDKWQLFLPFLSPTNSVNKLKEIQNFDPNQRPACVLSLSTTGFLMEVVFIHLCSLSNVSNSAFMQLVGRQKGHLAYKN